MDQNDPRITKIGKFLRKSSLDEIPQLFNVLKGNMSLVGPRPEMPFIVEQYNEIQRERLRVLPGITGLWQLSGDRKKAIHENMDYDLAEIKGEFDRGRYKRILVTGFPLERGSFLSPYKTYTDLAAATLVRMGVRADRVVAVPGRRDRNDRTFAAALALRDWLV